MATQVEVAAHLDLSDRSIRELIEKGAIPTARQGKLDLDECRIGYIRHLRKIASGKPVTTHSADLTAERARLAREQADNYNLKNEQLRRDLLPRCEVTRAVTAAFTHVRDRLTALPARLAGSLARTSDVTQARAAVARAIDEVLIELSETKLIESVGGPDAS